MARKYSNTFAETTLTGGITNSGTSITINSTAGLPSTFPYSLAIDYGTANVEIVTVTALAGSTLTVVRGQDGTSAQAHNPGARVVHPLTARDVAEPQAHIDATADVHGLSGGAALVGTTTTQVLTNKTLSGANNTLSNIGNASIVDVAAAKVILPFPRLTGTGADGTNEVLTVTGDEATRTKPVATVKRGGVGLVVGEAAVVEVTSDLSVDAQRPTGAAALLSRLYVKASAKIGLVIDRVVSQTQDLVQIRDESASNLFKVTSAGAVAAAGGLTVGGPLSGVTTATIGSNTTVGGTLGVTGLLTASGGVSTVDVAASGNVAVTGTLSAGAAANQTVTTFDNAAIRTTTSTSYTNTLSPANIAGAAFVAPPSGKVLIHWSVEKASSTAGAGVYTAPAVKTGTTVGSGTSVVAASDDAAILLNTGGAGQFNQHGQTLQVVGLTPGQNYNVSLEHRVTTGTGSFSRRRVIVNPCLA